MTYKSIAIIRARGGSKRFPNKNSSILGGISLLSHSMNYAKENGISKSIVSSYEKFLKN